MTRLQQELERLADMDEANDVLRERVEHLEAVLKPFADLASVYVRRADALGWKDADGVFGAADSEMDKTIRVADCRAAVKALE